MSTKASPWTAVAGALLGTAAMGLWILALTKMSPALAERAAPHFTPAVAAVAIVSMVVVVWRVEPAYTLSAAIFLTPFAGNWPQLGVPGPLSPDRLLLAGGIVTLLLRAPRVAGRPRLQITGTHWLLTLAATYALGSALVAGTLTDREALFKIVDAFGIMPFLLFLVAPLAFATPRQRQVLLVTFVALAAYLGLTTLFETAKLDALVFPKYILDTSYGIHVGRGRGPFVDAVANGLALYTCAVACAIAAASWRARSARVLALAIGLLCIVGTFLSLERSVWIGVVFGTIVALLATRGLRRYLVPVVVAVTLAVAASLILIPGLSHNAQQRANNSSTVWDRKNLARAATNMVEAKPLLGFGWNRFTSDSRDYFQQAFDYPLTATKAGIHNTPLTYAVDLGLVGATLWLLGVLFGVGTALATRVPPELVPWRSGLLAIAMTSLVVVNSVPPTAWLNRSLWLFAGVVYSARYAGWATSRHGDDGSQPSD
jgi:putative inorganic carbon (hco3(-)) transporter